MSTFQLIGGEQLENRLHTYKTTYVNRETDKNKVK